MLGAQTCEDCRGTWATVGEVDPAVVGLEPWRFPHPSTAQVRSRTISAAAIRWGSVRVVPVTVRMSTPSRTRTAGPPSPRSSVAASTETGPTPSISQSSPPWTEPRRSASASTITRAWGRAAARTPRRRAAWRRQASSRKASSRWASRGSPLPGLPASLGIGFEAGGDLGPGDLVAEELAPDAPTGTLVPSKVAAHVDTGPPGVLALAARARRPAAGRRRRLSSRCDAPWALRSKRVPSRAAPTAAVSLTSFELRRREVAFVEGPGEGRIGGGPPGGGQARPGYPAEEPETAPSHSAADP